MGLPIAMLIFLGMATAMYVLPSVGADALRAIGITSNVVTTAIVLIVSAGGVGGAIYYALGAIGKRNAQD